jgi:hypothetical protein
LLKKATASLQGGPALSAQELQQVNDYRVSKGAKPILAPTTAAASKTPAGWDYASAAKLAGIKPAAPQPRKLATGYSKINQPTSVNYSTAPAPAPAPAANPMSSMVTQLTNKPVASSTGGKVTTTPTGLVHTAKVAQPTSAPAQFKGRQPKVSATPPAGAPTSAEYANLEKRLQQAMAAQGQRA